MIQQNDLKDLTSKNDFLRKQTDQLNEKIISLEKTLKDNQLEKEKLNEKIHDMELSLAKKKTKIKFERKENQDLIEKLGLYVDKDNISRNILRNKNDDLEKIKISNREKEKELKNENNNLKEENLKLTENVNALNQEIARLNDLIELFNSTNIGSKSKITDNDNVSMTQSKKSKIHLSSISIEKELKKRYTEVYSKTPQYKDIRSMETFNFENNENEKKIKIYAMNSNTELNINKEKEHNEEQTSLKNLESTLPEKTIKKKSSMKIDINNNHNIKNEINSPKIPKKVNIITTEEKKRIKRKLNLMKPQLKKKILLIFFKKSPHLNLPIQTEKNRTY